ncbi:hypothetical protein [Dactylosporangium cerinum]
MRSFLAADESGSGVEPGPLRSEFDGELPDLQSGAAKTFDPVQVALPATGPPDIALLVVHDDRTIDGVPRLRLDFHFHGREESRDDDVRTQAVTDLSVASIAARRQWQTDFDQLRSWWKKMCRLAGWMRRLADTHPVPRLLVWDNTTHQIPWELYYDHHPDEEARSRWLGAELEIMRCLGAVPDAPPRPATPQDAAGAWLLMESDDDIVDADYAVSNLLPRPGRPR